VWSQGCIATGGSLGLRDRSTSSPFLSLPLPRECATDGPHSLPPATPRSCVRFRAAHAQGYCTVIAAHSVTAALRPQVASLCLGAGSLAAAAPASRIAALGRVFPPCLAAVRPAHALSGGSSSHASPARAVRSRAPAPRLCSAHASSLVCRARSPCARISPCARRACCMCARRACRMCARRACWCLCARRACCMRPRAKGGVSWRPTGVCARHFGPSSRDWRPMHGLPPSSDQRRLRVKR
jgi:hypothetical protein